MITSLQRYLTEYIDGSMGISPGLALREAFVIRNGRAYQPVPVKPEMRGRLGMCFANAARAAESGYGTYTEGFAWNPRMPIAVHHGWITTPEGFAADLTWPDTADCEYFGVQISLEQCREAWRETGMVWSVLGAEMHNLAFMRQVDPDLIDRTLRHPSSNAQEIR